MAADRWEDHYARRARNERWLARSVYKLQEIDKRFNIIRRGNRLLDLGCYPGSWSQYGVKKVGAGGRVVGIDLKRPHCFSSSNFLFLQADVLTLDVQWLVRKIGPMDVVVSDLAPQTTGIKTTDEVRSVSLAERALEIALDILKQEGRFVCKVFEGEGSPSFQSKASAFFRQTRIFRPKATRKRSREVYIIGSGLT